VNEGEATISIRCSIAAAGREPISEFGQVSACVGTLPFIIAFIADLLLDDAGGVEVGFAADAAVPAGVMPS
jgi:hypothetical protein